MKNMYLVLDKDLSTYYVVCIIVFLRNYLHEFSLAMRTKESLKICFVLQV